MDIDERDCQHGLADTEQDEIDALRKDAERYRWLRDSARLSASLMMVCGEALDDAIDAERKDNGN